MSTKENARMGSDEQPARDEFEEAVRALAAAENALKSAQERYQKALQALHSIALSR